MSRYNDPFYSNQQHGPPGGFHQPDYSHHGSYLQPSPHDGPGGMPTPTPSIGDEYRHAGYDDEEEAAPLAQHAYSPSGRPRPPPPGGARPHPPPGPGAYPPTSPPLPYSAAVAMPIPFPQPQFGSYSDPSGGYHASPAVARETYSVEAWGARQGLDQRKTETQEIELVNGHYVHEIAVPSAVKAHNEAAGYHVQPREFSHMRYSAVTTDPDYFDHDAGWTLRAEQYGRSTELLIAITAYNEKKDLLSRSLYYVMENIRDICKEDRSEFRKMTERGGLEAKTQPWEKIVVAIIFDGIEPADKASLDVLATVGLYQDGIMKSEVLKKPTHGHLFEYTTCLAVKPVTASDAPSPLTLVEPVPGSASSADTMVPVQMIFVLKQNNEKKINSHRWLFNALAKHLDPEVCMLIDAGTKPGKRSLYYLWEAFHHNKDLGGACGEITAMLNHGKKLGNFLVAAQNFEYKMSNILDKPLEHSFGYISVLPGAFSAYRYQAILGRPLEQYFRGDHSLADRLGDKGINGMKIFERNMFLAEDRILCFELVAKQGQKWTLGYVKPAKGETDVPEEATELISQRRRWLNGSFAAGIYSLAHFNRMYKSSHSWVRMFFFHVQTVYVIVGLVLSWFALANWYVTFSTITNIVHAAWRNPWQAGGLQVDDPMCGSNGQISSTFNFSSNDQKEHAMLACKTVQCWTVPMFDNSAYLDSVAHNATDHSLYKTDWLGTTNDVLHITYLALIAIQVILALGNRPKGERWTYVGSFTIFAGFALYTFLATLVLTINAFCPYGVNKEIAHLEGHAFIPFLDGNIGAVFAGLAATFGIYVVASILYLDPWHMLFSFPQYLLMTISWTNILNVYAFCNLHDVTWGTKEGKASASMGAVSEVKKPGAEGPAVVETKIPTQADRDADFPKIVTRAFAPFDKDKAGQAKPTPEDRDKSFRSRLIICWLVMNSAVALVIGHYVSASVRIQYFVGVLYITAALSLIRFLGFMWYLTGEWIFRAARLCARRRH